MPNQFITRDEFFRDELFYKAFTDLRLHNVISLFLLVE